MEETGNRGRHRLDRHSNGRRRVPRDKAAASDTAPGVVCRRRRRRLLLWSRYGNVASCTSRTCATDRHQWSSRMFQDLANQFGGASPVSAKAKLIRSRQCEQGWNVDARRVAHWASNTSIILGLHVKLLIRSEHHAQSFSEPKNYYGEYHRCAETGKFGYWGRWHICVKRCMTAPK